jgi:hypothetical protein
MMDTDTMAMCIALGLLALVVLVLRWAAQDIGE